MEGVGGEVGGAAAETPLTWMPHMCVSESGQHWFRYWLVTYSAPSHGLNQCWIIVNWTLGNKLHWFLFYPNAKLFIHENASQNIVCEMAAILSRGKWVHFCVMGDCNFTKVQVKASSRFRCGDTCQIWIWYSIGDQHFDHSETQENNVREKIGWVYIRNAIIHRDGRLGNGV